jgi:hypothetical protein
MTKSGGGDRRADRTPLTPVSISGSFRSMDQAREGGLISGGGRRGCWCRQDRF